MTVRGRCSRVLMGAVGGGWWTGGGEGVCGGGGVFLERRGRRQRGCGCRP
ncbi:hypothetical protein BU14_0749s0006 [Porphyra umbilicalis]|uniref:Uncharacterized protein n=1 Tax=Porphyra umbilicalis TaxID=2786 RepID=A0A1X6NPC5_PORUM|nr:hypothetical protein BU14_0749s0006 [Porphyra umbilicalis]|eukprot:OSX70451.1 hypothetical protein BU14_0749s0006 [Porphyra umbilicalis]